MMSIEAANCRLATNLSSGIPAADAISGVPLDRWDADGHQNAAVGGQFGGFVAEWARFDADFFGISPSEAALMDPAQRTLLEVTCKHLSLHSSQRTRSDQTVSVSRLCASSFCRNMTERCESS